MTENLTENQMFEKALCLFDVMINRPDYDYETALSRTLKLYKKVDRAELIEAHNRQLKAEENKI